MKTQLRIMAQGFAITAPILLTVYICVAAISGLETTVQKGLEKVTSLYVPGMGIALALVGIYIIGLLGRVWLFRKGIEFGEWIVGKVPLVKSLYSAVKDLMQFVGTGDKASLGRAARLTFLDGKVHMLGIITQRHPEEQVDERERGRVAVYLPMSLQIGGFTVYVPEESVEEIEGMSVESVMKLTMTASLAAKSAEPKAQVSEE